ncbi:MAG: trypsin [Rariglobus sp.]|jgi:serine protease Do|nr:trypsin [Rariglobus sp.]
MSFPRFFKNLCISLLVAVTAWAQDAQEIVDASAKIYADATAYSAQIESRTIQFTFPSTERDGAAPYRVTSTLYRRSDLKVSRPNNYLLGTQTYTERQMSSSPMGAPPPTGISNWVFLARSDAVGPKQGSFMGGRFSVRDVPESQFEGLVNSRLGYRAAEDLVLRYFQAKPVDVATAGLSTLVEPGLIGRESQSRPAYRIIAKSKDGYPIMLWIDQETFLIVRSIVQRPQALRPFPIPGRDGGPPVMPTGALNAGRNVTVVETFYKNQQLSPRFGSTDFTIPAEPSGERLQVEELGFIGVDDLVKLAEVAPLTATGPGLADSGEAGAPGEEAAPTPAEPAKPAPIIDGQALTYEQMQGIVLIEGDGGGSATGFITKIRDVDFVVTNLHVLCGNKKLTLKTLSGEEIPYMGIFGATGCDIAIIRIGKGMGDLRLATDVFKTSKIGDKVVVVGNRRGGGVATQTAGSVKGVGPKLIEVDANFQPGNSGSPIVNLGTNEVIGVATYSETRRVEVDGYAGRAQGSTGSAAASTVEKRWFGYRLDSVAKWEAIDLARWNVQGDRLDKFRETSEALLAIIKFNFKEARQHPRLMSIIDNFEARYRGAGNNSMTAATEVKDLFRVIRTISEDGVRDLSSGDYYDYYRTCQYWENSITAQLEFRKEIIEWLKKYEANSSLYLSRMRNGS